MNSSFVTRIALVAVAASAMVATTGHAQTVPSFGSTTGEIGFNLPGLAWANEGSNAANGYNFIYSSVASATGTGALDNSSPGDHVVLQGVQTLPVAGSSFLALDGDFNLASGAAGIGGVAVGGTVTGLTNLQSYTISYWASDSQQTGYSGDTTDNVNACIGATTASPESGTCSATGVVSDPEVVGPNDTAWVKYSFTFTANSSSELLTFLDTGTPTNPQEPAFALIDGITITPNNPSPTPEPSSLMLLGTGLAGLSGFVRSRFKKSAKV